MIHPSYSELIEAINTNNEDDDQSMVLNSRYSLVLATSKRARQLIAGAKPLVEKAAGKKPLSIAIDELYQGKVKILPGKSEDEEISLEENLTAEDAALTENGAEAAAEDGAEAAAELSEAETEDAGEASAEDEAEEAAGEETAESDSGETESEENPEG